MKLKQILLCGLMVLCCAPLGAQTSKEEMFATPEKTGESIGHIRWISRHRLKRLRDISLFISVITDGMVPVT